MTETEGESAAPPSPVWQRNLLVLSGAQLLAVSAMGIVLPLIPFFVRELGVTDRAAVERWSGLIFSGPFLAAGLMSPVWGHLGDRYGHKKMVVRAIAGLAVVNLLLVFVQSPLQFYLLRFLQGLVTGFIPASLAITSASTPPARLPEAMGKLHASASAGRLIGPAVGGLLAGFLGFRDVFLLVGAVISVGALLVVFFLEDPPRAEPSRTSSPLGNFRVAMADGRLRIALLGLLVAMAAMSLGMPIFPLYVEDLVGPETDPKQWTGIGFAVVAAFTLLTSWMLGRISESLGLKIVLVAALFVSGIAMWLHTVVRGIPDMLAIRALLGIGVAGVAPVLHSMIARGAPEGSRGGMAGLASAATILGFFAGPISGGWLANLVGVDGVFRIAGVVMLGCGLGAAVVARRTGGDRRIVPVPEQIPR